MPAQEPASARDAKKIFAAKLCAAARKNDAAGIAALAASAPAPSWLDARDDGGHTALCEAAALGKESAARALLAAGAQVEARDERKQTPLLMSCSGKDQKSWPSMARLLLDAGADPDARNEVGSAALHWCAFGADERKIESARLLLARGASPDARDLDKRTPAHLAAQSGAAGMILALAGAGARFDLPDAKGRDASAFAAYWRQHPIAALCKALDLARREADEVARAARKPKAPRARRPRAL